MTTRKDYINAQAIFTFANHGQEMGEQMFRLDVTEAEDRIIYNIIRSMFDMDNEDEREMISDIVKVSLCFDVSLVRRSQEEEQLWELPVMKAFLARNGKYYFDEEQRDDVEASIKELLDSWKEEIV